MDLFWELFKNGWMSQLVKYFHYGYNNLTLKFEYNQQETSIDYLYYYVKEKDATAA